MGNTIEHSSYYDLAWNLIKRYNRFLTEVSCEVFSSAIPSTGLFSKVTIDSNLLPFGDKNRGINNTVFDITEIEHDPVIGLSKLRLLERSGNDYGGISPSATIASFNPSTKTLTIAKNEFWPTDLKPCDVFHDGDKLLIKRMAYLDNGTYTCSDNVTIAENGIDDSL